MLRHMFCTVHMCGTAACRCLFWKLWVRQPVVGGQDLAWRRYRQPLAGLDRSFFAGDKKECLACFLASLENSYSYSVCLTHHAPYVCAGVTSFEVDLEKKKVVVMGDITPYEVLESVSKVMKFAELWVAPSAKQQQQQQAADV